MSKGDALIELDLNTEPAHVRLNSFRRNLAEVAISAASLDLGGAMRGLGSAAGQTVGSRFGGPLGGILGGALGGLAAQGVMAGVNVAGQAVSRAMATPGLGFYDAAGSSVARAAREYLPGTGALGLDRDLDLIGRTRARTESMMGEAGRAIFYGANPNDPKVQARAAGMIQPFWKQFEQEEKGYQVMLDALEKKSAKKESEALDRLVARLDKLTTAIEEAVKLAWRVWK